MLIKIRTWQKESLFVFVILFITAYIRGFTLSESVCGMAVWLTFMHGQVSERLQYKQSQMLKPTVGCYKWSNRYFLGKEILWIFFFILVKSYSAIIGSVIFFLYPFWRKYYIKKFKTNV